MPELEDITLIEDQVSGLEAAIAQARKNKERFIESMGVCSQIERESVNLQEYVTLESELKEHLATLKKQRSSGVSTLAQNIKKKLSEVLPYGEGFFSVSVEGRISIGWEMDEGVLHPLESLSGGERVLFNSALANVFGANIIIQEAAEMDEYHLLASLSGLTHLPQQVIVNTWFPIPEEGSLPLAWKVFHLNKKENGSASDISGHSTESSSGDDLQ